MPALSPNTRNSAHGSKQASHLTPEAILSEACAEDNKYSVLAFHMR